MTDRVMRSDERSSGGGVVRALAVLLLLGVAGLGVRYVAVAQADDDAAGPRSAQVEGTVQPARAARPTYDFQAAATIAQLKRDVATLKERETRQASTIASLRSELHQLTMANGVLERVVGHIRRIDGEAVMLRSQIASAFGLDRTLPSPAAGSGYEEGYQDSQVAPDAPTYRTAARAAVPEGASVPGARHQIVTTSAGQAPEVTPRMSDVPLPRPRPGGSNDG